MWDPVEWVLFIVAPFGSHFNGHEVSLLLRTYRTTELFLSGAIRCREATQEYALAQLFTPQRRVGLRT